MKIRKKKSGGGIYELSEWMNDLRPKWLGIGRGYGGRVHCSFNINYP